MKLPRPFLAGLWLVIALACGAGPAERTPGPRTHAVRIDGMAFAPAILTVRPGDTVEFTNTDLVPHTVTERSIRQFDSGMIDRKGTWKIVCSREGRLEYRCLYHPTMLGSITVTSGEVALSRGGAAIELCGAPVQ